MTAPLVLSRPRAGTTARPPRSPQRPSAHRVPGDAEEERIAATAKSLAVACLEIFAGVRRSESIARWTDPELLEKIDRRAQLRAEIAPAQPMTAAAARPPAVGRAQVCRIDEAVAEVAVIVATRNRVRAVAVRLERLTTRWTMTALQTM